MSIANRLTATNESKVDIELSSNISVTVFFKDLRKNYVQQTSQVSLRKQYVI